MSFTGDDLPPGAEVATDYVSDLEAESEPTPVFLPNFPGGLLPA